MTASTAGTGTCLAAKGLDISLAALQRQDPYINNIVDVASQVALYTFSSRANEWEKTDVEGTLFVYTRLASPRHGFTIMNRLSMDNLTEPITKDLDFQLQDPFLLYRNARLTIYGIWFYDKEDCLRIATLMKNLTTQEQLLAQQGGAVSPRALHNEDSKAVDILHMLTKARNEYDKGKPSSEPKEIASSSLLYNNPNLIKPIPVKPLERQQSPQHPAQDSDPEPRHLSVAALFGAQSHPEHISPHVGSGGVKPVGVRPAVARSLSYEEPVRLGGVGPVSESPPQHCPAIQKLMSGQRGAELLQPVSESPENRLCENGGHPAAHHHCQGRDPLQRLFHPAPAAPCCSQQPPLLHGLQPAPPDPAHPAKPLFLSPAKPPQPTGVVSPHELLQRLQLVQQEQALAPEPVRPTLAPRFQDPVLQPHPHHLPANPGLMASDKPHPLFQGVSPQRVPVTVAPSLLMSPMVFTQTKPAKSPPPAEDPRTLTKSQLQATLLHLIQNDAAFLDTIYKAYISGFKDSVTKKL
ncbi:mRNA-decapping enzyme 1B isoform X2 [Megalops cyprinoides]|uniref:mRNA-decapping enzyme 1B isoform X2 n=1 Tax=Megalops cyprinoides TaxID=118141 RepID=UPI0018644B53|nr:mRNA-decapping enzyme 1B isoform X2 [Megalops cyprinoides]